MLSPLTSNIQAPVKVLPAVVLIEKAEPLVEPTILDAYQISVAPPLASFP